jgi:hypothetical protein
MSHELVKGCGRLTVVGTGIHPQQASNWHQTFRLAQIPINPHIERKDSRTQGPVAGLAEISLVTHQSNFYVGRTQ